MTPDRWLRLAATLHRILIIFDDWLCDEFEFSRKARGKYADN